MGSPLRSIFTPTNISLAIAVAISQPVYAKSESSHTEDVVVWGTKVSSNTESVFAEDIAIKQADHLSDLLRDVPGVDVGGTHSVNQRINIRGLGETDLDIRLDGASQHANMFHHIGNLTLNPDILKSAEIQVGNNSVALNGLGGSVYFETKDARDLLAYDRSFGMRHYGGYATNDSHQGSITAYGALGEHFDAMIYGNYVSRDNFTDGDGNDAFGADGDVYNILTKVGFDFGDIHRLELAYDIYRDSGEYSARPDMAAESNIENGATLHDTDYDRDTITLNYELSGENNLAKVSLYHTETEVERDEVNLNQRFRDPSVNSAKNRNIGLNAQFQSNFSVAFIENELIYGGDYLDNTSSSVFSGSKFMEESAISTALFIENKFIFSDMFNLSAGVRFDDYKRKATKPIGTTKYDDVTWSLATELTLIDGLTFFASTRTLFKGPELMESYIKYQDVAVLADDLKAETGINTQGGVRFEKQFGRHDIGFNFTAFKTNIDDYIKVDAISRGRFLPPTYIVHNVADVEIEGFETSMSYRYEDFQAKLSYSESDIEDKDTGEPITANGSSKRSLDMGDNVAFALDYYVNAIDTRLGWSSQWVRTETNVFEGAEKKDGYDVHNLYAQWTPSSVQGLTLTFGIDNVFDELYTSHASTSGLNPWNGKTKDDYEPGRNFKLSVAYQF